MAEVGPDRSANSHYQYASLALESRNIRLLTLHAGNWNEEIQCSIRTVSLDDSPFYEAISYVWGSPKDAKAIILDGYEVSVRANLESVLRRLRRSDQPLSLWTDALCIDQENSTEKTHQVSMMGEIYSACDRVYIWLGDTNSRPNNEGTELSATNTGTFAWNSPFALVEHFAADRHYSELPGYISLPYMEAPYKFDGEQFQPIWQAFSSALSSEWWTRLWCVQEALLPKEALVMFSHWSINWSSFITAVRNHQRHSLSCCVDTAKLMASRFVFHVDDLVLDSTIPNRFECNVASPKRPRMDYILRRYRHKRCQDPRDKVYGLLGVIETPKSRTPLPDYSLTLTDVLINAMVAIVIESDGDLRYLTGSGFNSHQPGVPSWVRDLTLELDQHLIYPESQRVSTYDLYNACDGTLSKTMQEDRTQLVLTGFTIDRICRIGELAWTRDLAHINETLQGWHRLVGLDSGKVSFSSNSRQEYFWRTVVAEAIMDPNNRWRRLGSSELTTYELWASSFPFSTNPGSQAPLHRTFFLAMRAAICGRAMFITERGHIGLCQKTAQAGDEVWILHGGLVPFILRPIDRQVLNTSHHYAFVGDCYVTGFMDGEAFQGAGCAPHKVVLV